MVTKKQRRRQLARATAARRALRRQRREIRRRRLRMLLAGLAVLVAVTALVVWILSRQPGNRATALEGHDYDGGSVARSAPASIEVGREQSRT